MPKRCDFQTKKRTNMKLIKLLTTAAGFALALSLGLSNVQAKGEHKLEPKHGGVVVESNHIEYELVVTPDHVQLHANDHGKVMDLSQAKGKVTFLVSGQKMERMLVGHGAVLSSDGVDLKDSAYTAVTTVEFANKKKATVRFKSKK